MPDFAPSVTRLIDELKRLPGIGQKTAQRLAFYLLRVDKGQALALSDAIREAREKVRECSICNNITDSDPCLFCSSTTRSKNMICVVEEATNIQAVEKTRQFNGLYHVLGGALSPLQGVGPDQLKIRSLIERLKGGTVEEIIVATNPTAEGEATSVYLSKLIKPLGVRVTRIAMGIPVGSDLEYADEVTMMKAMAAGAARIPATTRPMSSFDHYMAQYDHEHTNAWNKILHGIGIPVIIAGIILAALTFWRTGLGLFVGGWILLFAGHRIEGNKPAFFQGLVYFLVGPVWIAKELKDALFGSSRRSTTTP